MTDVPEVIDAEETKTKTEVETVDSIMADAVADMTSDKPGDKTPGDKPGEASGEKPAEGEEKPAAKEQALGGEHFKFSLGDSPLETLADLAAVDDLGSLKVDFTSNKEAVSMTVDELVRNTQKSVITQRSLSRTLEQRNDLLTEVEEMRPEFERMKGNDKVLIKVLTDDTFLAELRKTTGMKPGVTPPDDATITPASPTSPASPAEPGQEQTPEQVQQAQFNQNVQYGKTFAQEHIAPHAQALAEAYGADTAEIVATILTEIGEINPRFLTNEAVDEIINEKMVSILEKAGYVVDHEAKIDTFDLTSLLKSHVKPAGGLTPAQDHETKEGKLKRLETELAELKGEKKPKGESGKEKDKKPAQDLPPGSGSDLESGSGGAGDDRQARYEAAVNKANTVDEILAAQKILRETS